MIKFAPGDPITYEVSIVQSSLVSCGGGWTVLTNPDGSNDLSTSVTLTSNNDIRIEQSFGLTCPGINEISGTIWTDSDGDGVLNETGTIGGVTVELRDSSGNLYQVHTTDGDGNYEFTTLPDGMYEVVVTDTNGVLGNFSHTDSPNGATDTTDGTSKDDSGYTVDLDSAGVDANPVIDTTADFGYEQTTTNPISLASFLAERSGAQVDFTWTTQTEVANLGFHIYAQVDGGWQRVNEQLIPGQGDSVSLREYTASYESNANYFAIADIDVFGKETLHGPFKLGESNGTVSETKVIDWQPTQSAQVIELETQRQTKKREQMQLRNEARSQR